MCGRDLDCFVATLLAMTADVALTSAVMAGLDPAIHAFAAPKNVDARHKAGHDGVIGMTR